MSKYYTYTFVSPESLYARIKEELRAWFDTGAVDDSLFHLWTQDCLKKFYKTYLKINEVALAVKDYKAPLPKDFNAVREAWLCNTSHMSVQAPGAYYYQTDCRLTSITDRCHVCFLGNSSPYGCENCKHTFMVTHKQTGSLLLEFQKKYLLKPGNQNAKDHCHADCMNFNSAGPDTFDIRDNHMILSFCEGTVYMTYYSNQYDDNGYHMIPDDHFIQEYIRKYIVYMIMCQLYNQATDETFNQARARKQEADQDQAGAFITANVESRRKTIYTQMDDITRSYNRHNKYRIR